MYENSFNPQCDLSVCCALASLITLTLLETKWQKMIKSVSMTELQKIKKCVQFLINRKAVYAETGMST